MALKDSLQFEKNVLKGKDFLSLKELSTYEIKQIFKTTETLKTMHYLGADYSPLKGKALGMIFEKPSTRTRISFEVAMWQLGGHALYLNADELQLGRGESIKDTARVMSRYLDGIMIRAFSHKNVEELANYADIPIINGLTDYEHPCQVMADLYTIYEKKKQLSGLKLAYIGDGGNNMANSLLYGCSKVGMDISIASPKAYYPQEDVVKKTEDIAKQSGSEVVITEDIYKAAKEADILYTDVWTSMGQEKENNMRAEAFQGYQINQELVDCAKKDVIVMHCLPANRQKEITEEVLEGPNSVIFDEAENRLHVQKAILVHILS